MILFDKVSHGAKKKLADLAEKASIATHSFNSKLEDRKKILEMLFSVDFGVAAFSKLFCGWQ